MDPRAILEQLVSPSTKKRPPQAVKGVFPNEAVGDPGYVKQSLASPSGGVWHGPGMGFASRSALIPSDLLSLG
jgi:hypothetical protein